MQLKMGGKFLLKLNKSKRPIVNKYREGKMKRPLKRELKVPEIVAREPDAFSGATLCISIHKSMGMALLNDRRSGWVCLAGTI